MEKKAILQETYNSAFNDELEKIAESNKKNKKISHAKNIGTGLGASIVAGIPQSTIGLGVMARLKNQQPSFDEYTVNRKQTKDPNILKLRKNMNIDTPVYTRSAPAIKGGGGIYMPIKGNSLAEQGAHIWTKNKSGIATPFEMAMMSHELGHAKNYKRFKRPLMGLRRLSSVGTGVGSLVAAFSKDEDTSRNAGIAGSLLGSTTLAEESIATARGIKGVAKSYGGGIKGVGKALFKHKGAGARLAAMNVASYGSIAAAPYLTYKLKKYFSTSKDKK